MPAIRVQHANPGQGEATVADGHLADILEEACAVASANDGLVDLAESGVQAVDLGDLHFGLPPPALIGHLNGRAIPLAVFQLGNAQAGRVQFGLHLFVGHWILLWVRGNR